MLVENKLFATLDTSTRVLSFNSVNKKESVPKIPKKVLISDTVGFIKNLPHGLIESFKSTLAEVIESDILLHVIDISNPNFEEQIEVVEETLKELGADNKIIVHVFNKVDALENKDMMAAVKDKYEHSVFISAEKGMNIKYLMEKILDLLSHNNKETLVRLKAGDYKGLSELYNLGEVKKVEYLKTMIKVKMNTTEKNFDKIEKMYS